MKKILLIALVACISRTNAQFTKLHDFSPLSSSGVGPSGDLVYDSTFLYGMTISGGLNSAGTIFKILPNGTGYVDIFSFDGIICSGPNNGSLVYDGIYLYGMTQYGGTSGNGNIFKIKTDGTGFVDLFDFNDTNGANPLGALIYDGTFLYGMTNSGGTKGVGNIFKIKPNGTSYDTILNFNNLNGQSPNSSLIYDGTFLYGMTPGGGANSLGVVFKIKPDGTGYVDLLDFTGTNGNSPYGSLIYDGTFLYGMTNEGTINGYGSVFKVKPNGTGYSCLHSFGTFQDGENPMGSLVYDGTFLYGMTLLGGLNNLGGIFKVKSDSTGYTKLLDFTGTVDGSHSQSSFILLDSCLYGMSYGGGNYGDGAIFSYCKTNTTKVENLTSITEINVFPNPASDQFSIRANTTDKLNVDLYDVNGRHVFSANVMDKSNINVATFDNGTYSLTIKTADHIINKKLVILR